MNDRKDDENRFYFIIVPIDPRECSPNKPQFIVSLPYKENELEKSISIYQKMEGCEKQDIIVKEIYMTLEEFRQKRPQGYCNEESKTNILNENEKHKPQRQPKSLATLAAKNLANNPTFFDPTKATQEAKEQFEKAQNKLPKNKN